MIVEWFHICRFVASQIRFIQLIDNNNNYNNNNNNNNKNNSNNNNNKSNFSKILYRDYVPAPLLRFHGGLHSLVTQNVFQPTRFQCF